MLESKLCCKYFTNCWCGMLHTSY